MSHCPHCGRAIGEGHYCPHCGRAVSDLHLQSTGRITRTGSSLRMRKIALVCIILATVVAASLITNEYLSRPERSSLTESINAYLESQGVRVGIPSFGMRGGYFDGKPGIACVGFAMSADCEIVIHGIYNTNQGFESIRSSIAQYIDKINSFGLRREAWLSDWDCYNGRCTALNYYTGDSNYSRGSSFGLIVRLLITMEN